MSIEIYRRTSHTSCDLNKQPGTRNDRHCLRGRSVGEAELVDRVIVPDGQAAVHGLYAEVAPVVRRRPSAVVGPVLVLCEPYPRRLSSSALLKVLLPQLILSR